MLAVETLNALGVSLSANPSSKKATQDIGKGMTLAALGLQILVILAFVLLAIVFHQRLYAAERRYDMVVKTLWTLYGSMGLIFARCVYRLVEHTGNTHGDLDDAKKLAELSIVLRYEVFFYMFEAVLMLVNVVAWIIFNPGRTFARNVYLDRDGVTEIEYMDMRNRTWWSRWLPSRNKKEGRQTEEPLEL